MSVLITGDFQADYGNLDLCQTAWDEALDICEDKKLEAIIVAGDLKRAYNPVDVRVTKFWLNATKRAMDRGLYVAFNLGNHDRIGQYNDKDNWFPVLRRGGAFCADKPQWYDLGDLRISFLPFTTDKEELKRRAESLANRSESGVLIFHEDLKSAKYNQMGTRSDRGIDVEDLVPSAYRYCVGGHIHLFQKVAENVYYAGSPFTTDWGEANQRKGYVVIQSGSLEFVGSKIPGWYDATWPNFKPPKSWDGCNVRIHVECDSAIEFGERCTRARRKAEAKYPGAQIYVHGTIRRDVSEVKELVAENATDEQRIKAYVRQTCPENMDQNDVMEYLLEILEEVGGKMRTGRSVEFLYSKASKFLSFEGLNAQYEQGITILQGRNKDRMGKSNGSGKTSYVQTIPVALFGTTFKGQKHDRWAQRDVKGTASVYLALLDGRGRKVEIERSRRPTKLQIWVNGKEATTGMNPSQKDQTQELIESLTGYTWQTLANAVYIDQEVAGAFLTGTKAQRSAVLGKFQNLERFELGLKKVRGAIKGRVEEETSLNRTLEGAKERILGLQRQIKALKEQSRARTSDARLAVKLSRSEYLSTKRELQPKIDALEKKSDVLMKKAQTALKMVQDYENSIAKRSQELETSYKEVRKLEVAMKDEQCPTCHQDTDIKLLKKLQVTEQAEITQLETLQNWAGGRLQKIRLVYSTTEGEFDVCQTKLAKLERQIKDAKIKFQTTEDQFNEFQKRSNAEIQNRKSLMDELAEEEAKEKELVRMVRGSKNERLFLEYCERAFSRDGIPAFLNALMIPRLNDAAAYYAQLFADDAIQIQFEMENGEFVPNVLNATGGRSIEDQSEGEKALAGLITSFALREVAPKCNILILDEPGNGLDPQAAREFARALKTLKQKFDCIYVTSHNQAILDELESERIITIEKQRGVSTVRA